MSDLLSPIDVRRRLPTERKSVVKRFEIWDQRTFEDINEVVKGYFVVGLYDDGSPGEVFIHVSKNGSTVSGFADAFATSFSIMLQVGIPLEYLVKKFQLLRFEPAGPTGGDEHVKIAHSIVDYLVRWMAARFKKVSDVFETTEEQPLDPHLDS